MSEACESIDINLDISGPGVRIALYLQSILSVILVRVSPRDAPGAYWSMTSTSLALIISSLVTSLTKSITLLDAVIVVYLLLLPILASAFGLSRLSSTSTSSNITRKLFSPLLIVANWLRSAFTYAFALYVWISAPAFGSSPDCNEITKFVFFGASLNASRNGRTLNLAVWGTLTALFVWRSLNGWNTLSVAMRAMFDPGVGSELLKPVRPNNQANLERTMDTNFTTGEVRIKERAYRPKLVFHEIIKGMLSQILGWGNFSRGAIYNQYAQLALACILAAWAIIMTELELIPSNNPITKEEGSVWGFGQILPLILTISPLFSLLEWMLARRSSGPTSEPRILRITLVQALDLPTPEVKVWNEEKREFEVIYIVPSVFAVVTVDERDVFVTYERTRMSNPDWEESFDIEVGDLSTVVIRLFDFDKPDVGSSMLGFTTVLPFSILPPGSADNTVVDLPPLPLVKDGNIVPGASILMSLSNDIESPLPEPKVPERFIGLEVVHHTRSTRLVSRNGKRWGKQKDVVTETYNLPGV